MGNSDSPISASSTSANPTSTNANPPLTDASPASTNIGPERMNPNVYWNDLNLGTESNGDDGATKMGKMRGYHAVASIAMAHIDIFMRNLTLTLQIADIERLHDFQKHTLKTFASQKETFEALISAIYTKRCLFDRYVTREDCQQPSPAYETLEHMLIVLPDHLHRCVRLCRDLGKCYEHGVSTEHEKYIKEWLYRYGERIEELKSTQKRGMGSTYSVGLPDLDRPYRRDS